MGMWSWRRNNNIQTCTDSPLFKACTRAGAGEAAWTAPTSSIAFDGTDDYALTGDMAASIPQGAHSFSFWLKTSPRPFPAAYAAFLWAGPKGETSMRMRFFAGSKWSFTQVRTDNGVSAVSYKSDSHLPPLEDGTWQHWCYTCAATSGSTGDIILYVDGQAEITVASDAWGSTSAFVAYLARWGTNPNFYANCNIAEVTVWDYELSGTQVGNLYNSGTPTDPQDTSGISTDPIHYWRMGSNMSGSTTVLDEIGSVNLELYNGAAASTDVPT